MNKENWNEGTACAVMQVKACSKVCTGQTKNPQLKGLFFLMDIFLENLKTFCPHLRGTPTDESIFFERQPFLFLK